MPVHDARSLSPEAQADMRRRAVDAVVHGGMSQKAVARAHGVSHEAVCRWVKRHRDGGAEALSARKKGPPPGSRMLLTDKQSNTVRNLIIDKTPEQLKMPFALWTREAVRDLVYRKCGVRLAVRTVGEYLRRWGFTPQRPVRRAYEQNTLDVQVWLNDTYPSIAKRAKKERALIFWGDEMGMRSDDRPGRTYSPRGKTPVVAVPGTRFGCSMISAIANSGQLCFRVFDGSFNVELFLDFLDRLIKQAKRKVFLIVDGHPVHRANLVQQWRAENAHRLELWYLPGYSPDLNPDEMLNNDVKANARSGYRPRDAGELKSTVEKYLINTQAQPVIVRNYFQAQSVRYALPM